MLGDLDKTGRRENADNADGADTKAEHECYSFHHSPLRAWVVGSRAILRAIAARGDDNESIPRQIGDLDSAPPWQ